MHQVYDVIGPIILFQLAMESLVIILQPFLFIMVHRPVQV